MSRVLRDYNSIDWGRIFYYDETSPSFLRYAVDTVRRGKGDVAGHKNNNGYYVVSYNGSKWFAHRIIWIILKWYLENDFVIDHVDGNQLNNNIENLRKTTQKYNRRNASMPVNNRLGKTGVCFTTIKDKSTGVLYTYCTAFWREDKDGKTRHVAKYFSVNKMGLLPAHAAAIKFREDKIAELNEKGYGYTDLHGSIKQTEKEQ